jgi:hypothetical protein
MHISIARLQEALPIASKPPEVLVSIREEVTAIPDSRVSSLPRSSSTS